MSQGDAPDDCPPTEIPDGALGRELPILNKKGLHARASAKFVQTVERYGSDVTVTRCGETVGGRSIMGLLTLLLTMVIGLVVSEGWKLFFG